MDLEEIDQITTEADEHKELHEAIEVGNIELVRNLLQDQAAGQFFSYDGFSALYKAFYCKEYDIASFLIRKGAKIENVELYDLYYLDIDLMHLNSLLFNFNKKSEKSCIFQLISWSQSPQGLDEERLNAVVSMYEDFFESKILKSLMNVLESKAFDIVYDFESEDVNRIHRYSVDESEIYGLTLTNAKEIFIGAQNLLSAVSHKRAKVYGVVAEEFCHLALEILFENNAKPYREEHSILNQPFRDIVVAVKCLSDHSCHIERVVKDVFMNYPDCEWECELIARVPHVIGIYGEESGRKIFLESSELSRLLLFYEENVLPKCDEYTDPKQNTKPQRMMEQLMQKNDFISFQEKKIPPLREGFPSFKKYWVHKDGIYVINTNCTKLCTLHVYHELKREFNDPLEKKCLFFMSKCFEIISDELLDIFKATIYEYLTVIVEEKELNLEKFKNEYLHHFDEFKSKGLKIVLISRSQSLGQKFQEDAINYEWNDLSDDYKRLHQLITYVFKGGKQEIYISMEKYPKVFSEEEITRIIDGEIFEISDGTELISNGYIPEAYVERVFSAITMDKDVFQNVPPYASIFLSGLDVTRLKEFLIDEKQVQRINRSDDEILADKLIFLVNNEKTMSFKVFLEKNAAKTNIWLHYEMGIFYVRNSNSYGDIFKNYLKQSTLREEELLGLMKRKRIIIISDNAGYGKSTVISSLISSMKKNYYQSWIWRIDFNKFTTVKKNYLSLVKLNQESDEEEVFHHLFLMLGISNGLEKELFKKYNGYCFLFFDGFDEIQSTYRENVLELLQALRGKTSVRMVITTRRHCQVDLEQIFSTYSHQLVPLTKEAQVEYLGKLWKEKLKYPNGKERHNFKEDMKVIPEKIKNIIEISKKGNTMFDPEYDDLMVSLENILLEDNLEVLRCGIDKLNFNFLAEIVLSKTSVDKDTSEFMGIPLHLYMVGNIHYDSNFNLETHSDVYLLYSKFIEQKVLIYLEEKQRLLNDGPVKVKTIKQVSNDAYVIHMKLADKLLDDGKVSLDCDLTGEELELSSALGIVFIKEGELHFIHKTFAEFFKAESIRQKIKKDTFTKMLFGETYNVVRKFLSCALLKKNFENTGEDLYKLLNTIMDKIPLASDSLHLPDSEDASIRKIINKVLENFEKFSESQSVNNFLDKVELILERLTGKGRCFIYLYGIYKILGCLTVNLLKKLITRNSKVKSLLIISIVRYSVDTEVVIDILKECISTITVSENESELCMKENTENGKSIAESEYLLELLNFNDSESKGLFYHTLWNGRVEMFVCLLKFFRDVLGKEKFRKAIVENHEFRKQLEGFLQSTFLNRICCSFKGFHSVFQCDFDSDDYEIQKMKGLIGELHPRKRVCKLSEELHSFFRNEIGSDEYWVQMKGLQEEKPQTNRICSSFKSLPYSFKKEINIFISKESTLFIIDTAVLLDSIEELISALEKAIKLLIKRFEREELKEWLLSENSESESLICVICGYLKGTLMNYLTLTKEFLGDDTILKQILRNMVKYIKNIFHLAFSKSNVQLGDLLLFCDNYFDKDQIKEILFSTEGFGNNVVHALVRNNSPERIMKNLNLIKVNLGHFECFKELLMTKDDYSRNIIQLAANKDMYLDVLLKFCYGYIGREKIKELLFSTDKYGYNVMHYLIMNNSPDVLMKNLRFLKVIVDDEGWFKEFLLSKGKYYRSILHYAAERDVYVDVILLLYDDLFTKHEIKQILLSTDEEGYNVMHYLFNNNSFETLTNNLQLLKNILCNNDWFKEVLQSESKCFKNIFHFAARRDMILDNLLQVCNAQLVSVEIKEMLIRTDENGYNVMHYLFRYNTCYTLMNNLKLIKECFGSKILFQQLLKSIGKSFVNKFHLYSADDMKVDEMLQFCVSNFEKDEIKDILLRANEDINDVMNYIFAINSPVDLRKNLKIIMEILGDDQYFKNCLKDKGNYFRSMIHESAIQDGCLEEVLEFCNLLLGNDELKDLLVSTDEDGFNVLHNLVRNNSDEMLMRNLRQITAVSGDTEWIKNFLMSNGKSSQNIFQLSSKRDMYLDELLQFCNVYLKRSEIKDMILSTDEDGYSTIHNLFISNSPEMLVRNIKLWKKLLCYNEWFNQLQKRKNESLKILLRLVSLDDEFIDDLLRLSEVYVEKDDLKEILLSSNEIGYNVIEELVSRNSGEGLVKCLKIIKQIIGDDEFFQHLLMGEGNSFKNILHLAAKHDVYLDDLLTYYDSNIEKHDLRRMLFTTDEDGNNLIHIFVLQNSSETLMKNLKLIQDIVSDDNCFRLLLKSKSSSLKNIFHIASIKKINLEHLLCFCDAYLKKDDITEMLISKFNHGYNVMHLLVMYDSSDMIFTNFNHIKEILGDNDYFKLLLKSRGKSFKNIFHFALNQGRNLVDLLQYCNTHLDKHDIKEMLSGNMKNIYNIIHLLVLRISTEDLITNLKVLKEILDNYEWFSQLLMSKGPSSNNIFHIAAKEDKCLKDLLLFCGDHLLKDDIKKMLISVTESGDNVIHVSVLHNSSLKLSYNLEVMKEVVNDYEWFKLFLKSKGQSSKNIFHIAAVENMNLKDLLDFCCTHLEKEEIKEMLLSTDEDGDNVIHDLVIMNPPATLITNLKIIQEIIADDEWFSKILRSTGESSKNIFHKAVIEDKCLNDLLHFCDDQLEKDDIKEMLISATENGNKVIHASVLNNSPQKLMNNIEVMKEVVNDYEWFKLFLKSKGQSSKNIFHIAAIEDMYLKDLLCVCCAHLEKEDIKEMLSSTDKDGDNVIHDLVIMNNPETLMNNLKIIQEIISDDSWFRRILKSKGKSSRNIFHKAVIEVKNLKDLLCFCCAHLAKEDIKEMLLSTDEDGDNVIHDIVIMNNPEAITNNLKIIQEIISDDEWFRMILKSKEKSSKNIFHMTVIEDMYLNDLLHFCDDHLEKNDIKEMLISATENGNNVIHASVLNNSPQKLMNNIEVMKEVVSDYEWFKLFLKSKVHFSKNIFHTAAGVNMHLKDLLCICCAHLEKEDIKEMLSSTDKDGDNVIHDLVILNNPETLMNNLKIIQEIISDDVWFSKILKIKGKSSKNIFHMAVIEDMYLNDLLHFCDDHLEKDDMKEMLLSTDMDGDNVIHDLVIMNNPETLMNNLKIVQEIISDDSWFRMILKSKGKSSRNIFHKAVIEVKNLKDLLCFCCAHLAKEDIKEMLLSTDEDGDNVIHDIVIMNNPEAITNNLKIIQEIISDDEWFRMILKIKGKSSRNIFHKAVIKDMYLNDLLHFCDDHLENDDMKEMLLSTDVDGDNVIHVSVLKNSPENLIKNLELIKEKIGDIDWFKLLLMSKNKSLRNILQLSSIKNKCLVDLLHFCHPYLEDNIKTMIFDTDIDGDNLIHVSVLKNSSEILMKNLKIIHHVVDDDYCFKLFLKSKGQYSRNIFHIASMEDIYLNDLLCFYDLHFEKDYVKEMIISNDENGDNVIHKTILQNSSEMLVKNLQYIKEALGGELFKQYLRSKGNHLRNICHLAGMNKNKINISFLYTFFSESERVDFLMERDIYDNTCLHCAANYLRNTLVFVDYAHENLRFNESYFKELILARNDDGDTFLHRLSEKVDENSVNEFFRALKEKLSDDLFKRLLMVTNKKGETFLQNNNEIRQELMNCCKMVLEQDLFEELV